MIFHEEPSGLFYAALVVMMAGTVGLTLEQLKESKGHCAEGLLLIDESIIFQSLMNGEWRQ